MNNNKNKPSKVEFDFDYWMMLAKSDPDEFERLKQKEIAKIIESAPEHLKKRLYGLQWRIDLEVKRSKCPLDACIRLNQMMMEMVFGKNGLVETFTTHKVDLHAKADSDSVIYFKQNDHDKRE